MFAMKGAQLLSPPRESRGGYEPLLLRSFRGAPGAVFQSSLGDPEPQPRLQGIGFVCGERRERSDVLGWSYIMRPCCRAHEKDNCTEMLCFLLLGWSFTLRFLSLELKQVFDLLRKVLLRIYLFFNKWGEDKHVLSCIMQSTSRSL